MKFKSKSLISIILSIMMVISMILVAIPANAAVVDNEPVGAGASSGIIPSGEYLYYDFTAVGSGQINYCGNGWAWNDVYYDVSTGIIEIKLTSDMNFNSPGNSCLFKTAVGSWTDVSPTVPANGQNMIKVNSDGKSFTWDTYSGSSTTQYAVYFGTGGTGSGTVTAKAGSTTLTSGDKVDNNTSVTFTAATGSNSTFDGWYSDSSCTTQLADSSSTTYTTTVTDTKNVYAKFTSTASPSTSYYVTGRFRVKDESGNNESKLSWDTTNMTDPFKFQPVDGKDGVYYLETNCTLKELSEKISCTSSSGGTYDAYQFFFIYDGTNKYNAENTSLQDVTESSPQTLDTGGGDEDMRFSAEDDTSTDKVTLMLDTNSGLKLWYTTDGATTTEGAFTITDKTDLNGSLSFSVTGKKAGTADARDTVSVTAKPASGFTCSGIEVTYKDATTSTTETIEATGSGNSYTFVVPSELTTTITKSISVKGTFALDKAAYIASQGDGLWIDVAPDKNDSTATLIKWNNYTGSSHSDRGSYIFYVPKNVDLTKANIYNGYGSAVILNGTSVPAENMAEVSLAKDTSYTTSGGVSTTVKVMQGSTNAMFLHTTDSNGDDYDLPTKTDSTLTTKSTVESSGGSCTTMVYDGTTSTVSSAMALDTVKGRGNSSWEASYKLFGKYAFNMKLGSKTKLFGMDSAKSWCLLANNADESMMRNALTYQLAKEIGLQDTPEFRFVDIYDNGEYMGAYLVTEKVDVGSSKLVKGTSFDDINEDAAGTIVEDTVTNEKYSYGGGTYEMSYAKVTSDGNTSSIPYDTDGKYLLEFEITERYKDEASWFTSPRGQHVVVKSPEFATKEQVTYIAQKFAAMEEMIFTSDNTSTATKSQLSTVMDVESFAKMYLIQEFSSNLDAASTSYYITFDCSQTNPVFVANPVWDYDWAYGQYSNNSKKPVSGNISETYLATDDPTKWVAKYKSMDDSTGGSAYSIQSLLASKNSEFKSVIRKVWEEKGGFYETIQKYYGDNSQIDTWYSLIADSVNMNETRWGFIASDPISSWGSKNTGSTHSSAVAYLETTWTAARAAWLDTQFTTTSEYTTYTPDVPTIKLYAADGKTEISAVEQGTGFIIKVTSTVENNVVYRFFKSDGSQVGTDQSDGILEIATDDLTVGETYTYKVQAVYNGNTSDYSNTVSVTIDDKAGNKQVTIYFKSSSASAYVPSLSVDGASSAVMTRDAKTAESNGTYFGSTYSGSLKFYWFYTKMTLDTSVEHTLKFTTKDNRVNASTSYKFVASEGNNYYFAVDNLMGDTTLIDLTGKEEYIRNYHISATHMVYSATSDSNIGFTWINGTEYAMGTYLSEYVNAASLADLTSTSLLTIPSALTPNAMLEASSAPAFFTIKSATLAQSITAEIEDVSTLQYQLLDVNLDGKVDVKDSTMMQKALANI
ncbi:MAG: CotH kinase family protein [Ruminococcus sp.]